MTTIDQAPGDEPRGPTAPPPRFSADLLYAAARLYYLDDVNQADIAAQLGISRATVSRMLSEARRTGIVRIEVVAGDVADREALAGRAADALGLEAVHLTSTVPDALRGAALAEGVARALEGVGLRAGDVLLVSSGRTVYEITQNAGLPRFPGVEVAPMIGGQNEPDAWYQTNEIVRRFAATVGGHPSFLYAPALPAPELHATLMNDPTITRVLDMWRTARCAVVGVGPPPLTRHSIPGFVPTDAVALREAVGDVCSRFYDRDGRPVPFPGSDRLISTPLEDLREITASIAVAVGEAKVAGIVAGARAGYFRQLVTDAETATGLIAHVTADHDR